MKKAIAIILVLVLTGCVNPSQRFNEAARDFDFNSLVMSSSQFQHHLYLSKNIAQGKTLHVYLDGDGTPWERNRWKAEDPTARNPLILRLMHQDKMPSILLGRPCYYGLSHTQGCNNKYWTSHRYSKQVALSMVQALNGWLEGKDYDSVVLIGYSGGGALALLMAEQIHNISTVVTVSANLDVKKWSEFHGYSALSQSLNPADEVKLNPAIKQIHFAGKNDEVVPSFIIKGYAEQQQNARYYEIAGQDHSCCWEQEWTALLDIIHQ